MSQSTPQTPEQDMEIAQTALAANDLPHAVHHIAWALQADPQSTRALEILERIIAAAPNPTTLAPLKSPMSSAEAAVHAYIHAQQGDYATALQVIGQVNTALPDGRFLPWAAEWLTRPAAKDAPLAAVLTLLVELGRLYRGDTIAEPQVRARVTSVVDAVTGYVEAKDEPALDLTMALLLRKIGRFEESLAKAQKSYELSLSAHALVAAAYAQRAMQQPEAALESFQKALEIDPNFTEVHKDVGDLLVSLGRDSEGALAYGKVLDKYPDDAWAAPSYYFYQFRLDSDPYWKNKLLAFAAAHPDNQRAAELVRALSPDGVPYVDYLPEPSEAIINLVKQVKAQQGELKGEFKIGLSALEAPSAVLAVARSIAPAYPVIGIAKMQNPDPRVGLSSAAYKLWSYKGSEATPALPLPSAVVSAAVSEMAVTPFTLAAWAEAAQQHAVKLGESAIDDLLAVMVHPPTAGAEMTEWVWIQKVQVAAALIMAQVNKEWERPIEKKGWFGKSSEPALRKKALHALLFGAMDWTVNAGIIALTYVASAEPEHEHEIAKWFADRFFQMPKGGYVCYSHVLGTCGLRLPSLSKVVRQKFVDMASGA